jgi:hypothetical protein
LSWSSSFGLLLLLGPVEEQFDVAAQRFVGSPRGNRSKKLEAAYRSGPWKSWIKVKNPKAAAAIRIIDGTF